MARTKQKPEKLPPAGPESAPERPRKRADAAEILANLTAVAEDAVAGLADCVRRTRSDLTSGDKYDSAKASHLAYLTGSLVAAMGELRQQVKAERAAGAEMTSEERLQLVQVFLGELPAEQRAAMRAYLDELDAKGGVL